MPVGPGKYNDLTTFVRETTGARAVVLIVTEGDKGNGFSVQTTDLGVLARLPQVLRKIADQIERERRAARKANIS